MGDIKATPRNKGYGLLADIVGGLSEFGSKPFGYDNPPVRGLLELASVPALARTLNELSYGGALGTGSGMTWKPKADTVDAAMLVAPMIAKAPEAINATAAAVGKRIEPAVARMVTNTMERGGMPAQLLQDMSNKTISPATVWHGSPHKFDKFDSSKIGTGEGNQAYGHGIYAAEAKDVAGEYARMHLSGPAQVAHIGAKNGPDGAMQALKIAYPKMPKQWYESAIAKAEDAGNLYKVDLPDEAIAKMLDWDKPLSQQHPDVQKAISEYGDMVGGADWKQALKTDDKGSWFYRLLEDVNKNSPRGSATDTAKDLRDAGIPGIRYLDGGSRGTGAGTSNYVVFPGNESLLTILERNGKPLENLGLGR